MDHRTPGAVPEDALPVTSLSLSPTHTHVHTNTHTHRHASTYAHTHTVSGDFSRPPNKTQLFTWLTKGSDELPGVQLHLWPLSFSPPDRLSFLQTQKGSMFSPTRPLVTLFSTQNLLLLSP